MASGEAADPAAGEKKKERQEAWRQAQTARKKFVYIGTSLTATKQQVQSFFEKTPCFGFKGKAGESHRVFLFSADLIDESSVRRRGVGQDPRVARRLG